MLTLVVHVNRVSRLHTLNVSLDKQKLLIEYFKSFFLFSFNKMTIK